MSSLWRRRSSRRSPSGRRARPRREAILDDIEKGTLQKIVLYKYGISEYMYGYFKKTYFTTELVRVKYDDQRQLELDI